MTRKTGWPQEMFLMQDDCSKLSRWFASRIDARETIRRVFRQTKEQDMTQDEIIEMARQASATEIGHKPPAFHFYLKDLESFAKLVAAKERDEWAKEFAGLGEWTAVHILEARGEA